MMKRILVLCLGFLLMIPASGICQSCKNGPLITKWRLYEYADEYDVDNREYDDRPSERNLLAFGCGNPDNGWVHHALHSDLFSPESGYTSWAMSFARACNCPQGQIAVKVGERHERMVYRGNPQSTCDPVPAGGQFNPNHCIAEAANIN
ncbi:MAG: hypothetical protein NUV91_06125, partial [Candidatus Omnitrophica bacterium]|nr:hypothetical protein [Candidatus Omnitrophota bacterium]